MSVLVQSSDHPLLTKLRSVAVVFGIFILVGLLTRPLEAPAWGEVRSAQMELKLDELDGALGQGLVVGMLGGFRTIFADVVLLRMYVAGEKRDWTNVSALSHLMTTLDPRPEDFWIHSARVIAYNVPNWRIREEGGYRAVPEARQREIDREQAEQAFVTLQRGLSFHPDSAKLHLEMGQIYLNRLKDYKCAAEWFRSASELPGAPYYAARMYAQLLRRQGKDAEAYEYLKDLFQRLPDDPYAQHSTIYERIYELEEDLGIPAAERFMPGR